MSSFIAHKHLFGKGKAKISKRDTESDCFVQVARLRVFGEHTENLFLRGFNLLKINKIKESTYSLPISEFPENVLLSFPCFLDRIHVLL